MRIPKELKLVGYPGSLRFVSSVPIYNGMVCLVNGLPVDYKENKNNNEQRTQSTVRTTP